MPHFEAHTAHDTGRIVVALAGECDLRSRDELTDVLLEAVQASTVVVVDLAAVRFFDSSGLYALVTAHQAARGRGGTLHVVNATGTVATVLEITGVIELLRPPVDISEAATARPDQPA